VIARTTTPHRMSRCLAAVLLVLQGLAGGAVSLAHASERFSAPAHIEAQHGAGCVALHDGLRCVLCQFAGSQVSTQQVRTQAEVAATVERRPTECDVAPLVRSDYRTAPPRAPPASRS